MIDIIMKSTIDFYKSLYAKVTSEKNNIEALFNVQTKVIEMMDDNDSSLVEVLDIINLQYEQVFNEGVCTILLANRDEEFLYIGSAPNLPVEYCEYIDEFLNNSNGINEGKSSYLKQSFVVSNIAEDPHWSDCKDKALEHGFKAWRSTPVFDHVQNLLGVFSILYPYHNSPDEQEIQFMDHAVKLISLVIQHFHAKEKINFLRFHDELTGLPNRKLFQEKVNIAINLFKKTHGKMIGVLYFDLNQFKLINDTLGHTIGDSLLIGVAQRLKACIREKDIVSRQGADEFSLLIDFVSKQEVTIVANRIHNILAKSFCIEGHEIFVTPSIGISLYPIDGKSGNELLRKADVARNQAKKVGSTTYQFYEAKWDERTNERLLIENELRKALDKQEFQLQYQPIIDLATSKITGVEALIRWYHPKLGIIPPDRFIPIAEETGLIVSIGEWVLRTACYKMKYWQESGYLLSTISVNISIRQFYQPNFISEMEQILKETGITPRCLTIEITESMTMDVEKATTILTSLKGLGVNISIDDFGTGYSSLSYLKKFPIDYLKIDRSFIKDIDKSKDDENIATTILLMGQNLGLNVIAEGVETSEQLGILRHHNCNEAQGYLFSKPISDEELQVLVEKLSV
ncbi:GGDEF domain-containing protein [Neobacillus sp. YX16]|uniref:sensor domain-containing phosphodiesterase n=1 Tax=Neobacillus sp. YX16 TaxID=3047874 RepID=UPI0024C37C78|nr:GGDEF domain-containing protein [Neobacillus sp. YX16]WHZ05429.1 GGDEF domain-containing protein [Neobacillus sp. YX16]